MVNLSTFKKIEMNDINYAIFIIFSIFSFTNLLFASSFIYPNLETLLIVAYISSFIFSVNSYFIITYSHNPTFIKYNKFPKYGLFLSRNYWTGIGKEFFWIVIPISLFFYIFSLTMAILSFKLTTNTNNEFIFILCLGFSIFGHIFYYILSRERVKKYVTNH